MATAATATATFKPSQSFRPQPQSPSSTAGDQKRDSILRAETTPSAATAAAAATSRLSSVSTVPGATLPSSSSSPDLLSNNINNAASFTCDACHRRKTRCAMKYDANKCYSCDFHRQDCTFTMSSQSGKRKRDETSPENHESTKRSTTEHRPSPAPGDTIMTDSPHLNSGRAGQATRENSPWTSQHIGMTTELEPLVLDFLPLDQNGESQLVYSRVRKLADDGTFMTMVTDSSMESEYDTASLEAVENLVTPFGPALVEKYFRRLQPTFPILIEAEFRRAYKKRKAVAPVLLGAVYLAALKWLEPEPGVQTLRRPDPSRLQTTVCKFLNDSLSRPNIPTMQAGLLLSQNSSLFNPRLMAQLVTAGFDLGLHQDCSSWRVHDWEKGLRKRLAWALYMQDKWCALVYGRPSHIFASNWTVTGLTTDDFDNTPIPSNIITSSSAPSSRNSPVNELFPITNVLFFQQFATLTRIVSDILETFYTLEATRDFSAAGSQRTHLILARAKPIQIQLKDWFGRLPPELKIDTNSGDDGGANGGLHLAYFAAEITLHRCIIRSITADTTDSYLSHICRSAAKTRLISAMDFVNRLRPVHLRSFWPAASRTNFALISAFGILLRTTAQTHEEEEFYRARLREYRWTLSVSRKDAEFLGFAIDNLDGVTGLLRSIPRKPELEEFMANSPLPPQDNHHHYHHGHMQHGTEYSYEEEGYEDQSVAHVNNGMARGPDSSSALSGLASPATSMLSDSLGSTFETNYGRM